MRYPDFLEVLSRARPTSDELASHGLDDVEVIEIQRTFSFERRQLEEERIFESELERMVTETDCSSIEVALLRFLPWPDTHPSGVIVAYCEADPVVVRKDGRVVMYDHSSSDAGAINCGVDSEHFFDALAAFVVFRRNRAEWRGRVSEMVGRCSALAGGSEYADFFRMLCSFLE